LLKEGLYEEKEIVLNRKINKERNSTEQKDKQRNKESKTER
jgi:hypothetical protein